MAASVLLTVGQQKALLERIVELSKAIKPGNRSGEMGPVIDKMSLDKIERYVAQAEKLGAEILVDGRTWKRKEGTCDGGWWVGPTVILHKSKDDPAMRVVHHSSRLKDRTKYSDQYCPFWKSIPRKKPLRSKMPPHSEMQQQYILHPDW